MHSCLNTLIDVGDAEPTCQRSLWKVIWSCLATLFACTWVAIHPNIAQDRETPCVVVWRRAGLMLSMIIVPEMVVCWALRQFVLASYIATKHKDDGWTRTHGFFVIMGGFCYYSKTGNRETLTYEKMLELQEQNQIEWPKGSIVTSKVIEDRSKADWLTKSIVLIQTFWFCIQLFTRLGQHLVVTELEISTLAFAALNFIVYLLWWNKPFDVRSQILVRGTNDPERFDPQAPATPYPLQEYSAWSYLSDKWTHFKESCRTARNNIGLIVFIPAIFYGVFIAPFSTLYVEHGVDPSQSSLTSKKRAYEEQPLDKTEHGWCMRQLFSSSAQWVLVSVVAIIFGGIHLIAWPFHFPSGVEKWLWRGSAIALVSPAISLVIYLAVDKGNKIPLPHGVHSILLGLLMGLMFFMAIAYHGWTPRATPSVNSDAQSEPSSSRATFDIRSTQLKTVQRHTAQRHDKVILLLGPTGAGKSNFIERLAAEKLNISTGSLERGTNSIELYRLMNHPIWADRIVLVDTPGFRDSTLSEYGSIKAIREWILAHKILRVHALFYFDRISYTPRGGDKECWEIFMHLCGEGLAGRACLVTTTWDEVGHKEGRSTETAEKSILQAEKKCEVLTSHWKSYMEKGLQLHKFYNTPASGMEILTASLKLEDYSTRFNLENKKFRLELPPIEQFIFQLLNTKHRSVTMARDQIVQDIEVLREAGEATDLEEQKLDQYNVDLKRLAEELSHFTRAKDIPVDDVPESPEPATQDGVLVGSPTSAIRWQLDPIVLENLVTELHQTVDIISSTDIRSEDIVIVMMGPTGTGKTTFIESFIGRERGHRLAAGTVDVLCVKIPIQETQRNLILVDTPGFDDPDKNDAEILDIIAKWLESTYRRGIMLTGLIYFHRITDIRHDVGIQNTMNIFHRLVGPSAVEQVALVTTMWNDIRDKQIGVEREEQLVNNHWRPLIKLKAMTGRLDSENRETAIDTMRSILGRGTKPIVLQLQDELVNKKKSLPSTSAGKVAFTRAEAKRYRLRQLGTQLGTGR
ncbi:hypothetical protein CVT24_011839 [Panaeolus cyanescens]|uniref:G domain-containing protein n=1 Tax=Panaeolus cyanescens TaxID=181874 RepID=A0A409YNP8_9AGAR|nr:hypothetical protein CVT24_011839 [Panaeolus cyanescens]